MATGAPLTLLGLAQALGWSPLPLVSDARSPVFATLGRANFLAAFLALLMPLTLACYLSARGRPTRLALAALLVGEAAVMASTRARAGWLAAAASLLIFGLVWFWPRLRSRRAWVRAAAVAGALGLVGAAAVAAVAPWAGRADGSIAARWTIWRALMPLIARRPLLGYGPDTLELVFPQVYPPELVYYQGRGVLVDRAHNLLLDWAVTTGAAGMLAQAALLIAFFWAGRRVLRRVTAIRDRALLAGCLAAVGGAVVGNLVSFEVTATATATALLMALVAGWSPQPAPLAEMSGSPAVGRGRVRSARGRVLAPIPLLLALLTAAGVGWTVWQVNVRPVRADVAAREADLRAAAGDWPAAMRAASRAVALWPVEPAYRRSLSWATLQRGLELAPWAGEGAAVALLQQAEAELLAAADLRPGDYRTWAALGELYGAWGNGWDPARLPLAHQAFARAIDLAPHLATLYTAWGMVDLQGGCFEAAAERFRRAVDLDATDGYAFAHLAEAELGLGHLEAAAMAYREAVRWAPHLSGAGIGIHLTREGSQ